MPGEEKRNEIIYKNIFRSSKIVFN
jgi:hypothetical protein